MKKDSYKKNVSTSIILLVSFTISALTASAGTISEMYNLNLPDELFSNVSNNFPGNGHYDKMNPEIINANCNLKLNISSKISLAFIDEKAGFRNKIGYFTFDDQGQILEQSIVFENYSKINGGGALKLNDTIDIGTFEAGTNLGFYIVPNGNKTPLYSLNSLNKNHENYTAYYYDQLSGYGILGFEDLIDKPTHSLGYDDAIMAIKVTNVPEPATAALIMMASAVLLRKHKH